MRIKIINIAHLILIIFMIPSFSLVKHKWYSEGNFSTIFMPNPKELYMRDAWNFWLLFPQQIGNIILAIISMSLIFGIISNFKSIKIIERKITLFYIFSLVIGSTILVYVLPYTLGSDFGEIYSRLAHELHITGLPIYKVILFYHSKTFIIASFFLICAIFFWIRLMQKIIFSPKS